MLEGTKPFKGKKSVPASSSGAENSPQQSADAKPEAPQIPEEAQPARESSDSNAVNLGRREWFSTLVPAFGDGLVKLLRTSNNLQRDIHDALKGKADDLLTPDSETKGGEKI